VCILILFSLYSTNISTLISLQIRSDKNSVRGIVTKASACWILSNATNAYLPLLLIALEPSLWLSFPSKYSLELLGKLWLAARALNYCRACNSVADMQFASCMLHRQDITVMSIDCQKTITEYTILDKRMYVSS